MRRKIKEENISQIASPTRVETAARYKTADAEDSVVSEDSQDLRERTKVFALRIIKLCGSLPSTPVARILRDQLLRAGTSVGANYREAYRARSTLEFTAKLGICLQELEESAYWLELLIGADIVEAKRLAPLQDETNQLLSIFTTISKKTKTH